ncbi:MAG: hypothetical protein CME65_06510 [Halobacteriovoraceae bacterium]|nr:hypothetical protein [Halobacteriovoraceae bacterium]|tara:strand:+ start:8093 stop:8905 length:813 start_codon:yes stop_codon:yes gene_type:complete
MKLIFSLFILLSFSCWGQGGANLFNDGDEDLQVGGDIFQDFNEDLEATQVMEDERFYRYSRFFGINLGLGTTTFTDNRGLAYEDNDPSYHFSLIYFLDFQTAFVMGLEYSQHTMFIDTFVVGSPDEIIGAVVTSFLRPFFGYRYYIDTSDLGTAITYSNPYFVGRIEYWYQTNEFPEEEGLDDENGGGLGTGVGFGLEFPIELKQSYFNIEFLYHFVNYFDKFTDDYRQIPDDLERDDPNNPGQKLESTYGYDDLRGGSLTIMMNYHISW